MFVSKPDDKLLLLYKLERNKDQNKDTFEAITNSSIGSQAKYSVEHRTFYNFRWIS